MPATLTCPYCQPLRRPWGRHTHRCTIGLNFCDVGEDQALCQSCPVPNQAIAHDCDQIDVYTRLRYAGRGRTYIEAELRCEYEDSPLPRSMRCTQCPLRQARTDSPLLLLPRQRVNGGAAAYRERIS